MQEACITETIYVTICTVECLVIDNLGGVRLDAQNIAQCTALSAFTMVTHYAVAASDGWIGEDRLKACTQPLLVIAVVWCERGG